MAVTNAAHSGISEASETERKRETKNEQKNRRMEMIKIGDERAREKDE